MKEKENPTKNPNFGKDVFGTQNDFLLAFRGPIDLEMSGLMGFVNCELGASSPPFSPHNVTSHYGIGPRYENVRR